VPRKKVQLTGYKGMNQDLSISKFSPEYSFENFNICIDSNESNSMFTITNENGNIEAILYSDNLTGDSTSSMQVSILGDIIGKCILND
jgi:hypothetical protein